MTFTIVKQRDYDFEDLMSEMCFVLYYEKPSKLFGIKYKKFIMLSSIECWKFSNDELEPKRILEILKSKFLEEQEKNRPDKIRTRLYKKCKIRTRLY